MNDSNDNLLLIDQCLDGPATKNLPPPVGDNKTSDLQWNKLQRIRDLGRLSPKWDAPLKLSSGLQKPRGKGGRRLLNAVGLEDTQESRPFTTQQDINMNSQRLWPHA